MNITAEAVKQLRERTGAGMMECKKALVEAGGDLDAAAEAMRKSGLAKADKKAGRIAAEGVIVVEVSADGKSGVLLEVNCETDFVAREADFISFGKIAAAAALAHRPASIEALLLLVVEGGTLDDRRRVLIAKIGENISVRRFELLASSGQLGAYLHGTRIGALVAVEGGDAALAKDLAMHVAASNPQFLDAAAVPGDVVAKEREILVDQARNDEKNKNKPEEILLKMTEGRIRKFLGEITFVGQPFIKDPDQTIEKLLAGAGATARGFARLEVGAGIEKKHTDFAAEVAAQVAAATKA
jgi:elongation factor Ts